MIVYVLAVGLIGWTLIELTLYAMVRLHDHLPIQILPCLIRCLPLLAGLVMLIKVRALAQWLTDLLDL